MSCVEISDRQKKKCLEEHQNKRSLLGSFSEFLLFSFARGGKQAASGNGAFTPFTQWAISRKTFWSMKFWKEIMYWNQFERNTRGDPLYCIWYTVAAQLSTTSFFVCATNLCVYMYIVYVEGALPYFKSKEPNLLKHASGILTLYSNTNLSDKFSSF